MAKGNSIPSREAKFGVSIVFVDPKKATLKKNYHAVEIKDQYILLINHDRWDEKGVPHFNWKAVPVKEIREINVSELQRPKIEAPSPIIMPSPLVKPVN